MNTLSGKFTVRWKPLMNNPGLQAGDQKAHRPATRRPKGGEWRGKEGIVVSLPRLKSRGYS